MSRSLPEKAAVVHSLIMGVVVLLALAIPAKSQTIEELERNRETIEREMQITNRLLQDVRQTTALSLNELVILNNQIGRREELLSALRQEIQLTTRRIETIFQRIEALEKELEELRASYADMVRLAQRNRNAYQRMMFIFSSNNFNQAYLRMRYLQQYARHRQMQAQRIEENQEEQNQQMEALEQERTRQQVSLARQREEVRDLARERDTQQRAVSGLQNREQDLLRQLREQEQAARALQDAIRRIIAEERRRAEEAARAEGRDPADAFALTPEEQLLSDNFEGNRGSLPWPLERGVITGTYGDQPHPVLPGIFISNYGVNISTTQGALVRSIFDGTVSGVTSVPGGFYAVIIRHGDYRTVYSNLSEVFVSNGQTISIRQDIGVVGTEARENQTVLHLQVWKGSERMNPAGWIAR